MISGYDWACFNAYWSDPGISGVSFEEGSQLVSYQLGLFLRRLVICTQRVSQIVRQLAERLRLRAPIHAGVWSQHSRGYCSLRGCCLRVTVIALLMNVVAGLAVLVDARQLTTFCGVKDCKAV